MQTGNEVAENLAAKASRVGREMLTHTREGADDAQVTLTLKLFRGIAEMLVEAGTELDTSCSKDCMGAPVDGIRFWIPRDQLLKERELNRELTRRCRELEERLSRAASRSDIPVGYASASESIDLNAIMPSNCC